MHARVSAPVGSPAPRWALEPGVGVCHTQQDELTEPEHRRSSRTVMFHLGPLSADLYTAEHEAQGPTRGPAANYVSITHNHAS